MTNTQILNEVTKYGNAKGFSDLTQTGERVILHSVMSLVAMFDNVVNDEYDSVPKWAARKDLRDFMNNVRIISDMKFPDECRELNRFKQEYIKRINAVYSSLNKQNGEASFNRSMNRLHASLEKFSSRMDKEVQRFDRIMEKSRANAMQIDPVLAQELIDVVEKTLDEVAIGVDHSEPVIVSL